MTESTTEKTLLEAIDRADDEYDDKRSCEKQRHEAKMAEIEEQAETTWAEIADDAGLDAVDELHEEIRGLVETFIDLRNDIESMVYSAISDQLSGGYNETITVKNGHVHKYNRSRNSRVSFMDLVSGYYRDDLAKALRAGATDTDRKAILHGLDTIDAKADHLMGLSGYRETTEYDGENYDELTVKYKARKHHSDRKSAFYVSLTEEGRSIGGRSLSPVSRDPEDLKILVQNRDKILELQDQIHENFFVAIKQLREVKDRLEADLPIDFE